MICDITFTVQLTCLAHGEGQRFCYSRSYSPLVEAWTGSIAMCAAEEVFSYSPQPPKK